MPKVSFGAKARELYFKIRIYIAIILLLIVLGLRLILPAEFAWTALIALGLYLLPVIFEIHKAVTEREKPRYFSSFRCAEKSMSYDLDKYIRKNDKPIVQFLCYKMRFQGPFILEFLNTYSKNYNKDLIILITMLDPEWDVSAKLNKYSNTDIQRIKDFIDKHRNKDDGPKINAEFWIYQYTPHLYGILIGDHQLYVGRTYWDGDDLVAGDNEMEYFDTSDEHNTSKINEFKGWLKKCKQKEYKT